MRRATAPARRLSSAIAAVIALVLGACGGGSSGSTAVSADVTQGPAATAPGPIPSPTPRTSPSPGDVTFVNPLRTPGPDPYVIRANDTYYYTQTLGDRIALWSTPAMSRLAQATPTTIFVPPPFGPNSRDLWAPELHRLDGMWYVYYAAGDGSSTSSDPYASQRMFVLENDGADPMQGTWVDRGRLRSPDADAWAIDGTVMEYAGQRYFVWSGRAFPNDADQHLYIARMTNPWTLGPRVAISNPDLAWERAGRAGVNEGPQVVHNAAGDLFLLYSANGCWTDEYALGMLTLRTGGDPLNAADWVKSERPVFAKNAAGGVYGPGHNAFFTSPDGTQTWVIYHANASAGQGCGDARSTRMQPIAWRTDGTPDFGLPVAIDAPIAVPSGEPPGP